jgi:signal transduction histidine kinase
MHHAEAAAIDVTVRFDAAGREVEVSVRDDGRGFEWGRQRGAAQGHFGLQGMQERVEALRGRLTIDTAPGRGTTVTARVTAPPHDASAEDHEAGADRADADGAVPVTG